MTASSPTDLYDSSQFMSFFRHSSLHGARYLRKTETKTLSQNASGVLSLLEKIRVWLNVLWLALTWCSYPLIVSDSVFFYVSSVILASSITGGKNTRGVSRKWWWFGGG